MTDQSPDVLVVGGEAGDDVLVEVVPAAGGRLHRIVAFGHDVLRTPARVEDHLRSPFRWGAFPMVPWCNRVPGGRIVFGDTTVDVPTNVVDDGRPSAIHGLAYDRRWEIEGDGWRITGGDELPWRWSARQWITVDRASMRWHMAVRNDGDTPMPAGAGLHPWFTAAGGLTVRLAAERVYPRTGVIPSGDPVSVGPGTDLRRPVPPPWGLDDVFTGLGAPVAELDWPEWSLRAVLSVSAAVTHVTVAAFEDMQAVAVEPQTHATDGHRRLRDSEPGAIGLLAPGKELLVDAGLRFSVLADPSEAADQA